MRGVASRVDEIRYCVSYPVTNLVSTPFEYDLSAPVGADDTPYLLGQLLYNEPIIITKKGDKWSQVSVPSLVVFTQNKYVPLRGWVQTNHLYRKPASGDSNDTMLVCIAPWTPVYEKTQSNPHKFKHLISLSYDTRLQGVAQEDEWWKIKLVDGKQGWVPAPCVVKPSENDEAEMRATVVAHARKFLGSPYCWGGCSAHSPSKKKALTGFDCSGLIYRVFHAVGKEIPRNSRSQFAFATLREPAELQAGDVIFLSVPGVNPHISHVVLYTGNGMILEAWSARTEKGVMNVQPIHEVSVVERLGKPLELIKNGEQVGPYVCYGGTFF